MTYPSNDYSIAFSGDLVPVKVRAKYFEEYIGLTPLTGFMGTSPNDLIQIFEMKNGEGTSYRVPFRRELDYMNPIIGFNQAAGSEQQVKIFSDEIKLELLRFPDSLMGVPFVKKMTPVDVYDALRPLLLNAQQRYLVHSLFKAATTDLWPVEAAGPCKSRVMYGGGDFKAEWATGLGEVKVETGKLSVAKLRKLKTMAIQGGDEYEKEGRIKPVMIRSKKGFPEEIYVYLMDPASYIALANDPQWSQYMYRGVVQNSDQPDGLSGSRYRGMIEGILVYECPELSKFRPVPTVAWNLFCGAEALGLCWGARPWFEMESRDFNLNQAMAACEIRGQKAFTYPAFEVANQGKVERGIIHSLVFIGA